MCSGSQANIAARFRAGGHPQQMVLLPVGGHMEALLAEVLPPALGRGDFLRLHVHDDTIEHADIAEQLATLTTPTLPHELDHHEHGSREAARSANTPTAASNGHGSNENQIVGVNAFEPGTPRFQSWSPSSSSRGP